MFYLAQGCFVYKNNTEMSCIMKGDKVVKKNQMYDFQSMCWLYF